MLPVRTAFVLLKTLFSHTLKLFFLYVRNQNSHLYKTTYKVVVLYILMFRFMDRRERERDKRF